MRPSAQQTVKPLSSTSMTWPIFYKLLAIVLVAALGWVVGRTRWLGDAQVDPARVLANTAFYPSLTLADILAHLRDRIDAALVDETALAGLARIDMRTGETKVLYEGRAAGNGAVLGPFASYSMEKKLASDPSRFGRGAIEGVAGPEAANNAGAQNFPNRLIRFMTTAAGGGSDGGFRAGFLGGKAGAGAAKQQQQQAQHESDHVIMHDDRHRDEEAKEKQRCQLKPECNDIHSMLLGRECSGDLLLADI